MTGAFENDRWTRNVVLISTTPFRGGPIYDEPVSQTAYMKQIKSVRFNVFPHRDKVIDWRCFIDLISETGFQYEFPA